MSTDLDPWLKAGLDNGWTMPRAKRWMKWPGIRHARAIRLRIIVENWNDQWRGLGAIPTGFDEWVVFGIWHGMEVDDG